LQRLLAGALLRVAPFEAPHIPFTGGGTRLAEQEAVVPPLRPAQVHDHGPEPATDEAVPALQNPEAGALLKVAPFEAPQLPFTGVAARLAEQLELVPPFEPEQVQFHGPEPETDDAEPVLQSPSVGILLRDSLFDVPHVPLTALTVLGAVQEAPAPPLRPAQVQFHEPEPEMAEAVPTLQRLLAGALAATVPLARPQLPARDVLLQVSVPVVNRNACPVCDLPQWV
jgi:hypothetical protein